VGLPARCHGAPLPARLHELLGPRVVGVWPDALPPAQIAHGRLAAEPLQHDANLLFGGVPAPSDTRHRAYEGLRLPATLLYGHCFVSIRLGPVCSFPGALYPSPGSHSTSDLSGYSYPPRRSAPCLWPIVPFLLCRRTAMWRALEGRVNPS